MKIKITAILIVLATCSANIYGQKKSTHEFGIQLGNLQGFSLIYKKEIDKNELVRLQIGRADYNRIMIKEEEPNKRLGMNFSYGKEKRKPLGERTNFVHGLAGIVSGTTISSGSDKISNLQIGLAYILGAQYIINDQFSISLESMPSISGVMNKQRDSDTQVGYNLGFYNNIANITLVHRFSTSKKKRSSSE